GVLADTQTFTSTLAVPAGTKVGSIVITPFATDSLDDPSGVTAGVTVGVQSVVGDTTPPLVQDTVPLRAEVGDSLTVSATDPSGIKEVGFIVRDTAGTVLRADSLAYPGTSTNVTQKFRLGLDTITTFARTVTVEAFALDNAATPNRGVSSFSGVPKRAPADQDTLTIVAGTTVALPHGGAIGDAIVDPNTQTLYLTNTPLDQLEVFHLNTGTFGPPIRVGSRPVGIAMWPLDTLGDVRDSAIVANSGGTNLSIVDLKANGGPGAELRRRPVPNWSLATIKTAANSGGGLDTVITSYELADRPQYLGTTCRPGAVTACDSVIVVYSTTPTGAQPTPFADRGYLAWENITAPLGSHGAGHLFYEQASRGTTQDTIEIIAVRDTIPGVPIRDIEVGPGARRYAPWTQVDAGVSDALYVSDFLVNRASRVLSVATNFNGRTNLVRADSIYAFDWTLKQTGLMQVGSGVAGMDFDPNNAFDASTRTSGTLNKNDRLVYASDPSVGISVFDT
ncbi:MAG: hypothetical protein B7Z72_11845, partial [Gemmatimonadetes bacterium 21-71-4]